MMITVTNEMINQKKYFFCHKLCSAIQPNKGKKTDILVHATTQLNSDKTIREQDLNKIAGTCDFHKAEKNCEIWV